MVELEEWKEHVDGCIAKLTEGLEANTKLTGDLKTGLQANTELTQSMVTKMDALTESTQPVVIAMQSMQTGIRVIGRIGSVTGTIGKWALRVALLATALWIAGTVLLKTGSFVDAVQAFFRVMAGAAH